MSKCKKLFSIALATLISLQLLLVPTFAEGETTQDTTVTGKYTTADSLPAIYGAGVSIEDFESCTASEDADTFNYDKTITDSSIKAVVTNKYYGGKYAVVEDSAYAAKGTKAFKANGNSQQLISFVVNFNENKTDIEKLGSVAFYVDMPSGTVNVSETATTYSNYPDGKYGLGVEFKSTVGNNSSGTRLTKYDVTYYFKDGTKLVKQDESGLYPYNADGTVSTTGFEGYVSIDVKSSEQYSTLDLSTNYYMGVKTIYWDDWNGGWTKILYFDDFRVLNSDWFVPYAYEDFEDEASTWKPTSWYSNKQSNVWVYNTASATASIDTAGAGQGLNSLKLYSSVTNRGAINAKIKIAANNALFSGANANNGIAFYIDIPAATSVPYYTPITIFSSTGAQTAANKIELNAIFVYWFEDGSVLVKYGDDGIYSYDKNGNKTSAGFKGYVSVYFGEETFEATKYIFLQTDYNQLLVGENKYVYLDDIRPCNFNVVEDIVSGDAYYVNDTAIPVQKVGDTATLSVMTNLATLGMARNADGIAALRDVMLGYTTAAAKHNVNGDDKTDIRDLVALYTLAAQ